MFNNATLQQRIFSAFLCMGLIVFIVAIVGLSSTNRLSGYINMLSNDTLPSISGLCKVSEGQSLIDSSENSLTVLVSSLSGRQKELERIERSWKQIDEGFKEFESTRRTEAEDQAYRNLLAIWSKWKTEVQKFDQRNQAFDKFGVLNPFKAQLQLIQLNQENSPLMAWVKKAGEAYINLQEQAQKNRMSFDQSREPLQALMGINQTLAKQATQKVQKEAFISQFGALSGMILGPLAAVFFGIYFSNTIAKPLGAKIAGVVSVAEQISTGDLTPQVQVSNTVDEVGKLQAAFGRMIQNLNALIRQVQRSGIQITTAATHIAASGKQLEATMNEQVASTNEVAATAKEIAATSSQLVKTINEVEYKSQTTAIAASESQQDLMQMGTSMGELAQATATISTKLGVISEKANNINSIITTITKVADQTNLLSLNAAIEAEKAGEYGKGFSVVAREIRRLADQTAVATLDIENMITQMQAAVSVGVMEMDKFTHQVKQSVEGVQTISAKIESIIFQVQALTPRFQQVSSSMENQSQGAVQISEAMVQLSEAASQTAESLRGINGAIKQLNEAAGGLRQEISRFKVANA
jgi:methyl-accepting chemotaxis protein WspA